MPNPLISLGSQSTHFADAANVVVMKTIRDSKKAVRGRPPRAPVKAPNRLREIREARGLSLSKLAATTNKPTSSVARFETGEYQLTFDDAEIFAKALGVEPADIFRNPHRPIAVVGYIGAGAEVFPIDDHAKGAGLDEVECPRGLDPSSTVAVKVRGDSMWPMVDDGWLIFYSRGSDQPPADLVGRTVVAHLADGRTLVKKLRRGASPGRFDLLSTNAAPIEDVELEWASPVRAMLPPDLAAAA